MTLWFGVRFSARGRDGILGFANPVQIGRLQMYQIIKKQIRDMRVYYRNKTFLSIAKCHLLSSLHQAYLS